jgi:hypothetical protein
MAGARRAAARGGLQAASASADPEGGQEFPDVLTLADLTTDLFLLPEADERLEAVSTGAAEEFIERHAI